MAMIELLNIDCMTYMKGCEDNAFDLAIVDPPYREDNKPTLWMNRNAKDGMRAFGNKPTTEYFNELGRTSKNQIIFGANNFNLDFQGFVVWDKGIRGSERYSWAEIASLSSGLSTVSTIIQINVGDISSYKVHPTQKPVKLYEWLLTNYSEPGQRILDTHLGSGSSAIAAHYFGCDFVGMEIDKDYYDAAVKRFNAETAQLDIFG